MGYLRNDHGLEARPRTVIRIPERAILALLRRTLGRPKSPPARVNKILVTLVAGIGDCLLATPALRALRKCYPDARIVLLVNRRAEDILEGWSAVDAIVPLDIDLLIYGKRWGWCRPEGLRHLWQTWQRLRRERFDLAVNFVQISSLRGALLMGFLLKSIGATYRAGRDTDGRAAAFHVRTSEGWPDSRNAVVLNLALLEALGCAADSGPLTIPLSQESRRAADTFLAAHGPPSRPLIAIHPWVKDSGRQWPLSSWAQSAKALSDIHGGTFVILGGPQDAEAAKSFADMLPGNAIVAAGGLPLRAAAALLQKCDLFLGVLSSPLHIAAAVGTPIVACYPTELLQAYAPYTDPALYRLQAPESAGAPLSQISSEAVIEAAEELLARDKSPPPIEVLPWYEATKDRPESKPLKVAHIITRLDRGGSTDNTLLTVLGLDPARYRVTLVTGMTTFPSPLVRRLKERPDITVRFLPSLLRAIRPLADLQAFWALYRMFRRERFDLVHTHSSKAGILGRWAARLAGCRHLVHTPHGHVFTGYYRPALSRLFVYAERLTAHITNTIITLTPIGVEEHVAWGIAPKEKFRVIPSGVELEGFGSLPAEEGPAVRATLGLPQSGPVVGSVGRLDRVKGYDQLVEASAIVLRDRPDAWFVGAGDGQERRALEDQARRLGVAERWLFLGWQERLEPLYHVFDLSVLPSRNEGMGRAAVEALACGRPVVATAVGGVPSVVEDGVTGLLVPPEDPQALASAILQLLENETARRRMGEAGPQQVRERFSHQVMLDGIDQVYRDLLNSPC